MAIEGLTQQQSDFIERFLKVPRFFGRKERKQQRREAVEQFRVFNAAHDLLRGDILLLEDAEIKSVMLSRLSAAERLIEADPEALDFDAGHAHLDAMEPIVARYLLQQQAQALHDALEPRLADLDRALLQGDIALAWSFAEEKFESGMATGDTGDLESGMRAMARLDGMIDAAEAMASNPFATAPDDTVRTKALEGLSEAAQDARRRLSDTFNQLEALRGKLTAQFGENGVPLSVRIGLSNTQNKLDAAVDAAPGDLPGLADDAEAAYDEVQRGGRDMLAAAQKWDQDYAAFLVRYQVMQAHPKKNDVEFVKPEFDKITADYEAAKDKAAQHEYEAASQDIGVVRHDLKDALDFADDCANFDATYAEREALLATLPALTAYKVEKLKDDDAEARALLSTAADLRRDGQMTSAMSLLNQIPGAVNDILDAQKFAGQHSTYDKRIGRILSKIGSDYSTEVQALLADEVSYAERARGAAQDDADRGAYRSAAGQTLYLLIHLLSVEKTAKSLKDYVTERTALAARLAEAKARKGAEGRIAIEPYYQTLKENEAKRESAEAAGDFKMANAMCLRLKDDHAAMMALADDAKLYLAEKETYDTEFARLSEQTGGPADEAKATATGMLALAVEATTRGNWLAGTNLLKNAVLEIRRGISDAETSAVIDGLQEGAPKLTAPDSNFDAAFAVFESVMQHVNTLDEEAHFIDAMIDAELKARGAEDELADNPEAAQATLDEAIEDCRAITRRLTAAASFAAHLEATETLIGQAETANAESQIDDDITRAKTGRDEAQADVEEPKLDFEGAIRKLGQAQAEARTGLAAMTLYTGTIKDARQTMEDRLAELRDPGIETFMATHIDRLKAHLDGMNDDFAARKLPEATAKAAEGVEYASSLASVLAACVEVQTFKSTKIEGKFRGYTMNHATTTEEVTEIRRLLGLMDDAMNKGQFAQALSLGKKARSEYFSARRKAQAIDAWLPVKAAAKEKLEEIEPRAVSESGPAHDETAALRVTFDAAIAQEDKGNYHGAGKKLAGFVTACEEVAAKLDVYDRCVLQKTRARTALDEVGQIRVPAIEPLYARLEGKNDNAERRMAAHDFAFAADLFREVQDDCRTARDTKDKVDAFDAALTQLNSGDDDGPEALLAAVTRLETMLRDQKAEPSAVYAHDQFTAVETLLAEARAKAPNELTEARIAFEAAISDSAEIAVLMAQYDQLNQSAVLARKLAKELREDHALRRTTGYEDFALTDIATRMDALEVSMNAARASAANRPQTRIDIEETIAALRDLRPVMDRHLTYATTRAQMEERLTLLEADPNRHVLREELTRVRRHLDTAATRAVDRDHATAMTELAGAELALDLASLKSKLSSNTPPTPQDVQKIIAAPDGLDTLDGVINNLPASTQRDVMAVAFKARFGCDLEMTKPGATDGADPVPEDGMQLPAPNLRRFYAEMSKLPDSDTLDNDSMLIFLHQSGDQTGSAFSPSKKKVLMREGDESKSRIYAIAVEHEIGKPHEHAEPKPGQERTAFSWNTLHEVGHAVDDKLGFMKQHGNRLAGWKVYGADVAEAAAEIAGNFDFDADYVAEYMLSSAGRNLPIPPPVGCSAEEWRRRMMECRMLVDRARNGNNPWSSASVANACAVGEYTYVESYDRNWARYRTSERQYGVSGYQFRAPGEWFSELYAAFHSGRMNDNHPHKSEIEGL